MTCKAYLEVDGGSTWAGHTQFDQRPALGDVIVYGSGPKSGRATVIGFEHREQPDGFNFTVSAKKQTEATPFEYQSAGKRTSLPEGSPWS